MTARRELRVLLVDPSLFTGPYDAALTGGLQAVGVRPVWATRPLRVGEEGDLPSEFVDAFFYRWTDRLSGGAVVRSVLKGVGHCWGLFQLGRRVVKMRPDVVHFQWTVVPLLDAAFMALFRHFCPIVLTVHDTVPFNGDRMPQLQRLVFGLPITLSARVIVHTTEGKQRLVSQGVSADKISVIPHGPLRLKAEPRMESKTDGRTTFVLFGEIKHYKGADLLIQAVAALPPELYAKVRFIIAGRSRMELDVLFSAIAQHGLGGVIEIWDRRLSEEEMADLFFLADVFVFPYRQIDASGVYFLVKSLSKWVIATRVGVFAEDIEEGVTGSVVPPEDVSALSRSIAQAVDKPNEVLSKPPAHSWNAIAEATRCAYETVQAVFNR